MKVLIVRHGAAGDKKEWAKSHADDDGRPLTAEGREDVRRVAKRLRDLLPALDVVATSPLARAVQTAEILGKAYGVEPVVERALEPNRDVEDCVKWLKRDRVKDVVAVVGHEPFLGLLVSRLTGKPMKLPKGGACLIESGKVAWTVEPE